MSLGNTIGELLSSRLHVFHKSSNLQCEGFFRLPMPKVHHAHYAGGVGDRDVFVLENLLEAEYYNFENEKCLNEEHMKVRGKNDMK